eukprot:TRINITY_DN63215_c0_g1_i1.p1 TRINITY_DN63215_c0_g1~~TRINITY_DN63215_c0_g1_i1.p1  ORF type:complete len:470 (-),score=69.52 TRINITY_DN63215_c0_g1_i1:214-1542(-)
MTLIDDSGKSAKVFFFIAACRELAEHSLCPAFARSEMEQLFDRARRGLSQFLVSFACDPYEVVAETVGGITAYTRFLSAGLRAQDKDIFEILTDVSARVGAQTEGKERPWFKSCLKSPVNFQSSSSSSSPSISSCFTPTRSANASQEYSHFSRKRKFAMSSSSGNIGEGSSHVEDIRKVWRTRIDRITIKSNIPAVKLLLLTDTQGQSCESAVAHFQETGMGAHYMINKKGNLIQCVEEELCAWCGNPAYWGGLDSKGEIVGVGPVNEVHNYAISIALEGDGRQDRFQEVQYKCLKSLLLNLQQKHQIEPWNIVGLAEVCVPAGRYASPGQYFDWEQIADFTLCPDLESVGLSGCVDSEALKQLMQYWGYSLGPSGAEVLQRLGSFRDRYKSKPPMKGFDCSEDDVRMLQGLIAAREHSPREDRHARPSMQKHLRRELPDLS